MGTEIATVEPADDGRQLATARIKELQDTDALIYVHPDDLQTQSIVRPEVVVINAGPDDFHDIPSVGLMPKRHHTDRIGEACGITFDEAACITRREGLYTYVGHAAAKKRLPDGTWRTASAEYEFDVENRCKEDFLKPKNQDKYDTDVKKERHLLATLRFARQKADAGARMRVIRTLAGIPTAFNRDEIQRAMVFCRIALNTDRLMSDPATRSEIIQGAIGAQAELFGPTTEMRDATPQTPAAEQIEAPAEEATGDPWELPPEEATTEEQPAETTPEDVARMKLDEWLGSELFKPGAVEEMRAALDKQDVTLEELQALAKRCEAYKAGLDARKAGGKT